MRYPRSACLCIPGSLAYSVSQFFDSSSFLASSSSPDHGRCLINGFDLTPVFTPLRTQFRMTRGREVEKSVHIAICQLVASLKCIMKSIRKFWFDALKSNCGYTSLAVCLFREEDLCCCFLANQLTWKANFYQVVGSACANVRGVLKFCCW